MMRSVMKIEKNCDVMSSEKEIVVTHDLACRLKLPFLR